jgi:hypothetical protein
VSTCAQSGAIFDKGYCDPMGVFACPPGYVTFSSCPPRACVRGGTCCDQITGAISHPSCGPNGLLVDCPTNSVDISNAMCIPPSLGVSDCFSLDSKACNLAKQQCYDGNWQCTCGSGGDGGLVWLCFPPPPV